MSERALIIGYGSIGQRHAGILESLGCQTLINSKHYRRANSFINLDEALAQNPCLVAICSETALHAEHFTQVLQACPSAKILIEKPLGFIPENIAMQVHSAVGYNLRFHLQVLALKKWLAGQQSYHASISIQRHLPTMRRNADYTKSYSCYKSRGGGVLKDFSHDLDLALSLFGPCHRVVAHGGKIGQLHGDSDDHLALLMKCKDCPSVAIHMSYLNTKPERKIQIVCNQGVAQVDLDANTGLIESALTGPEALHSTYVDQWKALLFGSQAEQLCTVAQAVEVEKLIEMVGESVEMGRWVIR